jgi:hypothetical protein
MKKLLIIGIITVFAFTKVQAQTKKQLKSTSTDRKDTAIGSGIFVETAPFWERKINCNTGCYNFAIGYMAIGNLVKGSFNIVVKEHGLEDVSDTSFAFLVDYNTPMLKDKPMIKQYLYQVDLLFQDNPELRKDTLFQIAIHKQLNSIVHF